MSAPSVKVALLVMALLGWFAASAFVVWMLYASGHPVWAGVCAMFFAAMAFKGDEL